MHDTLLFYAESKHSGFNSLTEEYSEKSEHKGRGYSKFDRGVLTQSYTDDTSRQKSMRDVWEISYLNSQAKERTGYPTQKSLALPERVVKASSNKGDIVLDPFCGCTTTCVDAERLNRKWIGIDISIMAYDLVQKRLIMEVANPEDMFKYRDVVNMKTDPPKRSDLSVDYREKKFVYVISHPQYEGEYRVGITKNWNSRLNSYQTSGPDRQFKLEFKFETPWFRKTRKYIHEKFENKHEWVRGNLNEIISAIKKYRLVELQVEQDSLI